MSALRHSHTAIQKKDGKREEGVSSEQHDAGRWASAVREKRFPFLTSSLIMLRISLRVNLEMLKKTFLIIISFFSPSFFGSSFTCANFCWGYCCMYYSWWLVCSFSFCHSSEHFKPASFTAKPPWAMWRRCLQPSRSPLFVLHLQQSQKKIMSNLFAWFSTKMQSISVLLREQTFLTALIAQHKEFTAKKKGLSEGCLFTTEYSSSSEDPI